MFRFISNTFVSLKSRLYLGFQLMVFLFIINGIVTLVALNRNQMLSDYVANIIEPASQALKELNEEIIKSKMLSVSWVFVRANDEDKKELLKLHDTTYPQLKASLLALSPVLFNKADNDSLKNVITRFEELIRTEQHIIAYLNSFEKYDDPFVRMEMEMTVENDIIPQTTALLASMQHLLAVEQTVRQQIHDDLSASALALRRILLSLALMVIVVGVLFSMYLAKNISNPILKLCAVINDIGHGKLRKIAHGNVKNEINGMAASINNMSENIKKLADFATEIGQRNFTTDFTPLSDDDVLGKALISMRDNLRESDYRLNQAQSIAKLGSWQLNWADNEVKCSDEIYHIMGYEPCKVKPCLQMLTEHVLEEDREETVRLIAEGVNEQSFACECKILTADNILKVIYIHGHAERDVNGDILRVIGIVQDITSQKQAEEKLKQNNNELMKTNRELDKFVYSVSHDLRAPLSSMLGIVQLTEEDCEDDFIKGNLGMVKTSILKLDGFIQDILAYSRNSRMEIKREEINFDEVLREIGANLQYMGGTKNKVNLIMNITQDKEFKTDISRMNIVLNNLVSNAIRYHNPESPNPFVEVNVKCREEGAQIVVADNGIGIKKELQARVFEMFYRVSEKSVGSGLGLYIVKETIDKLNGTIEIESEPGSGTKFIINLPNAS